jgi:hypothetical protein
MHEKAKRLTTPHASLNKPGTESDSINDYKAETAGHCAELLIFKRLLKLLKKIMTLYFTTPLKAGI